MHGESASGVRVTFGLFSTVDNFDKWMGWEETKKNRCCLWRGKGERATMEQHMSELSHVVSCFLMSDRTTTHVNRPSTK